MKFCCVEWSSKWIFISIFLVASPGYASEFDGRKGVGFASAIGGPSGLAMGYGVGNLLMEGIIGLSRYESGSETEKSSTLVGFGLAAHFQILRSRYAALSMGARFNLGAGSVKAASIDGSAIGQGDSQEITQFGFDAPLRIYWFPDRHISIHTELGVAVMIAPTEGVLFGKDDENGRSLGADGIAIHAFQGTSPMGKLGLTFWW